MSSISSAALTDLLRGQGYGDAPRPCCGVPLEGKVLYESNLDCSLNFWGEVLFKPEVLSGEFQQRY